MAGDVRTRVVLSAETKGFDKALRQTLGMNEAALKGLKGQAESYKVVQKEISGYRGKLDELSKTQLKLSRSMETMGDKGTDAYKALKDGLREVNREARDIERVVQNLEKAYRKEGDAVKTLGDAQKRVSDQQRQDARQARGAFMQGAIQAGVPGMAPLFMQRGPGMRRQALGMMAGGLLRRGVGGLGAAVFGGVSGLQKAISVLPGGGIIAGQLGAAAGFAGQALQYQRQRLEAAPFVGETGGRELETFMATRRRRRISARELAFIEGQPGRGGMIRTVGGGYVLKSSDEGRHLLAGRARLAAEGKAPRYGTAWTERIAGGETEAQHRERIDQFRRERARLAGRTIGGMGMRFRGIGRQEALQESAAIMQAAGGAIGPGGMTAEQQRFMGTAMAARTRFGLGPEVTGAFGAGARRGGLVGGRGRGAEAMTETLADAVKMGLAGSEVNTYMQIVAQGIQSFEQTGIPFSKESISAMGLEFSKAGIAGTRAARIAGGVQRYVSGIGQRGIRGGLDIMALQAFGGYTGAGGAEELERAMIQSEEMGAKLRKGGVGAIEPGGAMAGLMKKIMAMRGGGAGGRFFLREQLGKMGIAVGTREMSLLGKKLAGEKLTEVEQGYVDVEAERRREGKIKAAKIGTPEGLMAEAAGMIPASLKRQAAITNQQLAVGQKMLPTIQNLETASININKIFTTLAGEPLEKMTKAIEEFTVALGKAESILDAIKAVGGLVGIN